MRPSRPGVARLRALGVLVCVVALDRLTKSTIAGSIVPGQERPILPGLQFVHTSNRGVAFGFFTGQYTVVVAVIGASLLALLLYFARHSDRRLVWLPTGLLIGGALSNVIDRLQGGSVTDWIQLPLGWPPFNVADMAITFGVLLLAWVVEGGPEKDDGADAGAVPVSRDLGRAE